MIGVSMAQVSLKTDQWVKSCAHFKNNKTAAGRTTLELSRATLS